MAAMMTVANPGDKVVIFSPFYENYSADTILSGAVPIYVPLTPPSFTFDPEVLEDAFRQHPKALDAVQPLEPLRQGLHARGAWRSSRVLPRNTMSTSSPTRSMSTSSTRPHRHTYFATLPGMWERTLSCSLAFQDLFHHRLAPWLHHRPAGDHRPREEGSRFPHRRRGGAATGGHHPRSQLRSGLLRRAAGRVHAQEATCSSRALTTSRSSTMTPRALTT